MNPFMVETESTTSTDASEPLSVIPIPDHIDMSIQADVDRLRYTDMELKDMRGKLSIADQAVVIEDGSAKALGGGIAFTGAYDTQDLAKPTYNFKFSLQQLDFQQSFKTFNTFSSFAPIGQLVTGQFSTDLIMSGILGQDMMPDLNSIDAKGLFETLNGSLKGAHPLSVVGNALDIKELKESVSFDNLKSWFTIQKGFFEVEPFDVRVSGMPMTIAGKHSLTQEWSTPLIQSFRAASWVRVHWAIRSMQG
ncbi:MAG: AsmA-like C-terminal region-containing protein [Saprospiraceae bacterium]